MSLEALIFDVDGTLADTEKDGHLAAFNAAFADAGLDWHWHGALYGKLLAVTGGKERMNYYIDQFRPDYEKSADFDDMVIALHASKTRHYTDLMDQGLVPLRPGVLRLIKEARAAGLRLAIATTTTPINVTSLLRNAVSPEAESWFEVIGAGDDAKNKKPASDIYDYVLKKMAIDPENCLAFEDSENGIKSSAGASLKTIITLNGYTIDHNFDDAIIVLDHMGEPDQPFKVIAGASVNGATYLDLALLEKLYQDNT